MGKVIEEIVVDQVPWELMSWSHGFTLLHWAARNDLPDLCTHFLLLRADPEQRDDNGRSPLDFAIEHQSKAALLPLKKARAAARLWTNRRLVFERWLSMIMRVLCHRRLDQRF